MSFVISRKQYLAPNEPRAQYEPLILEEEDFEIKKIDVTFGHPLYTTVADIFYIRSNADTARVLPIIPDGCMALVFCGNREILSGVDCCGYSYMQKGPLLAE